jgi:hypothetical protein
MHPSRPCLNMPLASMSSLRPCRVQETVSVSAECCLSLNPPPLNLLELCGSFSASIPNVPWLSVSGARSALSAGTIVKGSRDLKERAESYKFALGVKLCVIFQELFKRTQSFMISWICLELIPAFCHCLWTCGRPVEVPRLRWNSKSACSLPRHPSYGKWIQPFATLWDCAMV